MPTLDYIAKKGPETMKKHLYDHFDSSPEEIYEHVEQNSTINEHEETTKLIKDVMRSYHETESERMIKKMNEEFTDFTKIAVAQFLKLLFAWMEISFQSVQSYRRFIRIRDDQQKSREDGNQGHSVVRSLQEQSE